MASVIGRGYNTGATSVAPPSNSSGVRVTPPDQNGVSHTIVPNTGNDANILASSMADLVGSNQFMNALYEDVMGISERHSAESQARAERQMEYQTMSDRYAMAWSAEEAKRNREWQEELSNNAHQREVQDLIRAGLNPILSAGGQGASTPVGSAGSGYSSNGAAGQVDMSQPSNIMQSYFSDMLNSANIMAQLQTQKEINEANNATSRFASMNSLQSGLANAGAIISSAATQAETTRSEGEKNRQFQQAQNLLNRSNELTKQQMINEGNVNTAREQHWNSPYGMFKEGVMMLGDIITGKYDKKRSYNIDPNEPFTP